MAINYVCIDGGLTRDAELRYTQAGKPIVSFSIAQTVTDSDGNEHKHYFRCVKFCTTDKQANFFADLTKGQRVVVSGRLSYREWEKDGERRESVEIRVNDIATFSGNKQAQAPKAATPPPQAEVYDENIPF